MTKSSDSTLESTLIYEPASIVEALPLPKLFSAENPLQVEIGSGDGSFLTAYAAAHPEWNFFGVERLLGRLRKIDRKARRLGLKNLRLMRIEAAYLTQFLLPPKSVHSFHIYFPDPWPKRRHWKNRLITADFTELLETALVAQGTVYLRTDNAPYFEQMLASFRGNPSFAEIETPAELSAMTTDFERNFNARGIPTLRAAFQLNSV
jgi:tRNA (guanine-N7-)-methyltransferase